MTRPRLQLLARPPRHRIAGDDSCRPSSLYLQLLDVLYLLAKVFSAIGEVQKIRTIATAKWREWTGFIFVQFLSFYQVTGDTNNVITVSFRRKI